MLPQAPPARFIERLIEAAHEINAAMPLFVVQNICDALNESGRPIK